MSFIWLLKLALCFHSFQFQLWNVCVSAPRKSSSSLERILWAITYMFKAVYDLIEHLYTQHLMWSSQQPCEVGVECPFHREGNGSVETQTGALLRILLDLGLCVKPWQKEELWKCDLLIENIKKKKDKTSHISYSFFFFWSATFFTLIKYLQFYWNIYFSPGSMVDYL